MKPEAIEKTRQKIKSLIEQGKVKTAEDMSVFSEPDGPVRIREVDAWSAHGLCGFIIKWSKPGFGFGELDFAVQPDKSIECDSEGMNKEFVMEVLEALVDSVKFRE